MYSVLPAIVGEHFEEAASISVARVGLSKAPDVTLAQLGRSDDRLAAHLDGLSVAGEHAWPFCEAALAAPSAGGLFTAAVRAIEERKRDRLDRVITVIDGASAKLVPECCRRSAGSSGNNCRGLSRISSVRRTPRDGWGIAACAMHRVDPGLVPARRILDPRPLVRARALRTAGEIGCENAVTGVYRGDSRRRSGMRILGGLVVCSPWKSRRCSRRLLALHCATDSHRLRAFRLALQAMTLQRRARRCSELARRSDATALADSGQRHCRRPDLRAVAHRHMANEKTARLAGEAFSLITGARPRRIAALRRERPEGLRVRAQRRS